MPVVSIRGRLGSGAPEVGRLVANQLGMDYIDREIIAEVASRLNRREPDVAAKEMPPPSLRERIAHALERGIALGAGAEGSYLPAWEIPLDDARYLEALTSLIKELAAQSMVIYGRGSQFILKGYPRTVRVSLVAPLELRLKRVAESLGLDEEHARREIERFDNSSREFVKRYYRAEVEAPLHYDLVVNTEYLSFDDAASLVMSAVRLREAQTAA